MKTNLFFVFILLNISSVRSFKLFFEPLESEKTSNVKNDSSLVHWVLLVAGSSDWENYRHQADVCHAYQIVKKHGIPTERIVTMMYDDIANNPENPFPGKIINHPNGQDVYGGVVIDYKGNDVTPENFLAILSGDEKTMTGKGSGKVIKSGPNDHVFVNFVDHGGPGILAFPSSELHAKDLINTIKTMHKQKKFDQLVLYVEACESGSIFKNLLPDDINVYVTTASNADESSYACYFDPKIGVYLGDVYSVSWMEDSDVEYLNMETLHKQYLIVKKDTNTSHVCEFGDKKISKESLDNFQGEKDFYVEKHLEDNRLPRLPYDAVPSEDVPLATLYHRLDYTDDVEEQNKLKDGIKKLIRERDTIEDTMKDIVKRVSSITNHRFQNLFDTKHPLMSHDCYISVLQTYKTYCFDITKNGYARKSLWKLVNMCEEKISELIISHAIIEACKM